MIKQCTFFFLKLDRDFFGFDKNFRPNKHLIIIKMCVRGTPNRKRDIVKYIAIV